MPPDISVAMVNYAACAGDIREVRRAVFVQEQGVPEALEFDGHDGVARHVLARGDDRAVGTGRILGDGHIGRVAVRAEWRRRGIGQMMMMALLGEAGERGLAEVWLSSQIQAAAFYRKLGFVEVGEPYLEAEIPHIKMKLSVTGSSSR